MFGALRKLILYSSTSLQEFFLLKGSGKAFEHGLWVCDVGRVQDWNELRDRQSPFLVMFS